MKQTWHNNKYYCSTDTELSIYNNYNNFLIINNYFVQNPPEFLPRVSQNVTDYTIAVGTMDFMTIAASIACPTSTCNYSVQSLSVFNSPLSASVSAVNVIGKGEESTPQTEIGTKLVH